MPRTTFKNDMTITGSLSVTGAFSSPISTGTAAAGAVTLAALQGKITTEALTTAANATYTLTVTNSLVAAADIVMVSLANGTNAQGQTVVLRATPAAGSFVVVVANKDAAQALNGTLVVSYQILKAVA